MTSVPKMACFNLRKIGLPAHVILCKTQQVWIADHCKKGTLSMFGFFLPFISILIYSSAFKLN